VPSTSAQALNTEDLLSTAIAPQVEEPNNPEETAGWTLLGLEFEPIGQQGGIELTISGTGLPTGVDLAVYLGSSGDETDVLCYGGQGYGYAPRSLDGLTIAIISPVFENVGTMSLTVVNLSTSDQIVLSDALIVVEKYWPFRYFGNRAMHPPWMQVGRHKLDDENPL
jgi:hypothetical protein